MGCWENAGGIRDAGVVRASMFFARRAFPNSVGRPERGKMSHEAECLANTALLVVALSSNICHARQIATRSELRVVRGQYMISSKHGLSIGGCGLVSGQTPALGRNHLGSCKKCVLSRVSF